MIESELMEKLKADTNVAALIGGRIWGGRAPKTITDSSYPFVVWNVISTMDNYWSSGATNYRVKRIQLDAYSFKKYSICVQVADAVRKALEGFQGALSGGTKVHYCAVSSDLDIPFEPGASGDIYRRLLEFEIAYTES